MTGQATELMAPVFDVQGFSLNDAWSETNTLLICFTGA